MGIYVEVFKSGQEDEHFIYYVYQFSVVDGKYKSRSGKTRNILKEVCGKLKIDKINGDVHIIELAEGDNGSHARRASSALIRDWKKGEFPDKTCWAS